MAVAFHNAIERRREDYFRACAGEVAAIFQRCHQQRIGSSLGLRGEFALSKALSELASKGVDMEQRLVIFWEDLRKGIPLDDARGVKQFEYSAWLEAAESQIKKNCAIGSRQRREWRCIKKDFANDKYYDRCEADGKISKVLYYFRRYLQIIVQLSLEFPLDVEVTSMNSYSIHIENNSGIVAVMSKLDNVSQSLSAGPLEKGRKDELLALLAELKVALGSAPGDLMDDAELVAEQAEKIGAEMSRARPRPNALTITAKGLLEAAGALGSVVPAAIEVARKIAEFVTSPAT